MQYSAVWSAECGSPVDVRLFIAAEADELGVMYLRDLHMTPAKEAHL